MKSQGGCPHDKDRGPIDREVARTAEDRLVEMFDAAWDGLPDEERAQIRKEREDLTDIYAGCQDG